MRYVQGTASASRVLSCRGREESCEEWHALQDQSVQSEHLPRGIAYCAEQQPASVLSTSWCVMWFAQEYREAFQYCFIDVAKDHPRRLIPLMPLSKESRRALTLQRILWLDLYSTTAQAPSSNTRRTISSCRSLSPASSQQFRITSLPKGQLCSFDYFKLILTALHA